MLVKEYKNTKDKRTPLGVSSDPSSLVLSSSFGSRTVGCRSCISMSSSSRPSARTCRKILHINDIV